MLADAGRVDALGEPPAAELERQRRHVDGLAVDVRLEEPAGRLQVPVAKEVPWPRDRRERQADRLEALGKLGLAELLERLGKPRDQPVALPDALAIAFQPRI